MPDRFQLNVNIEVMKLGEHGEYTGERLSIRQEYVIPVNGFTEIAAVLGKFHDLAEQVKRQ